MFYGNLTIIVVSDYDLYRNGLKAFLEEKFPGSDVRAFKDYTSTIIAITGAIPENTYIAIVDGRLGEEKGYELIEPLSKAFPEIKFISNSVDEFLNNEAIKRGAHYAVFKGEEEALLPIIAEILGIDPAEL
jgi:DNA-binding NarL/FixJ family response regulator